MSAAPPSPGNRPPVPAVSSPRPRRASPWRAAAFPRAAATVGMNVTSNLPGGPYTNTILPGTLQTSAGNNGATATAKLFVNPFQPPSVTKSFTPAVMAAGSLSTLTISIANGNATAGTLTSNFVDTLPGPGLTIANPPNLLTFGCTSANVLPPVGGTTVTYQNGGVLKGNGGLHHPGRRHVLDSPHLYEHHRRLERAQSTIGNNVVSASATLQVLALPTVTKSFAPVAHSPGVELDPDHHARQRQHGAGARGSSRAHVCLRGHASGQPRAWNACRPRRHLPGGSIVVAAGGSTITYSSGATIPPGGCTIKVPVTSAAPATYMNTIPIGAIQTSIGGNPAACRRPSSTSSRRTSRSRRPTSRRRSSRERRRPTRSSCRTPDRAPCQRGRRGHVSGGHRLRELDVRGLRRIELRGGERQREHRDDCLAPAGRDATFTVVANISPSAVGTLVNTATVTAPATVAEINPGNNTATDTDTLTPQADMQALKAGPGAVVPGQNVVLHDHRDQPRRVDGRDGHAFGCSPAGNDVRVPGGPGRLVLSDAARRIRRNRLLLDSHARSGSLRRLHAHREAGGQRPRGHGRHEHRRRPAPRRPIRTRRTTRDPRAAPRRRRRTSRSSRSAPRRRSPEAPTSSSRRS